MRNTLYKLLFCSCIALLFTNCSKPSSSSKQTTFIPASDTAFSYLGRFDFSNPNAPSFSYTGSTIQFRAEGPSCIIHLKNISPEKNPSYKNFYVVKVDDKIQTISVSNKDTKVKLKGLSSKTQEISIFKRTEALVGIGIFEGIELEKGKKILPTEKRPKRKIEFIGNSITCGYGNEGTTKDCHFSPETQNGYLAYGAITARKLNAEYRAVAYSGKGLYQNYDGNTKQSMSAVYDLLFPDSLKGPKISPKAWQPDVIVINLGTNDFAKGIPDSIIFTNTYTNFLKKLNYYYPNSFILCINGPMMNDQYPPNTLALSKLKAYIEASIMRLSDAGEKNIASFFPTPQNIMEYGCDYHPNLKRHEKMADELTKELKRKMNW